MNTSPFAVATRWVLLVASALLLRLYTVELEASPTQPNISSVRFDGKQVVVSVNVPAGIKKVTLESRARFGAGTWAPRMVSRLDGTGGDLTFSFAKSAQLEILRVRADTDEPLPASFYQGTNSFVAGTSTTDPSSSLGPVDNAAAPGAGGASGGASDPSRTVVESDIWNLDGNTLYFFNQYRGLQVIDLTVPDSPMVTGTYPLPAAGEQMYVLDASHVALLAQDNCSTANGGSSEVIVLQIQGGVPTLVASLPVPGWIQESRMVGTALYVASQSYQPVAGSQDGTWQWGSTVSSFDLSNPAAPIAKDTLWYAGYGNVISATDQFLFVAVQDPSSWWQSVLECIDISAPDGSMKALSSIPIAGTIPDKYKIDQNGDVLSVISENWNTGGAGVVTTLQTFSLADPATPSKLGRLDFPQHEQLHATRFDGQRVYVVTFFQMDPLWIVDLSDPAAPKIAGQLEVPGWSTYIQPLGDRLVAIGINNTNDWRVAVSLFDVHDPANPALLSKVPLGVNYSWSEASNDDKAFSVLPDSGLILVPYQGYETNGYASRVQLIDYSPNSLLARGTIDHSFQPRRATLHNDRIYSISGKELLTVDAADRDHPAVRSDLEISWSVDKVLLAGDYVLEVANGNEWYGWWSQSSATPPSIRVIKNSDADHPLNIVVLTNDLPVIGATLQGGSLYLLQGLASGGPPILYDAAGHPEPATSTNGPNLFLTVVDTSHLPDLAVLGQTSAVTDPLGWNASMQPLWTSAGVLVWSGGGNGFLPMAGVAAGAANGVGTASGVAGTSGVGGAASAPIGIWWPGWGGTGGRLFAFDVSKPASPNFLSEVNLTTNSWWSFSPGYSDSGLVYVSHEASEFVPGVALPGQPPPGPIITIDKATGQPVTNYPPVGIWVERYYLDVVDYADPKSPTLRSPVNIPGQLNGIAPGGALLYTVAPHWTNYVTDWSQWLDASAYDGVSASLVTSLQLPTDWPHPLFISGNSIFLGRPDSKAQTSQIETWVLSQNGQFTKTGSLGTGTFVNNLALFGKLMAAQLSPGTLLLDATNPASLATVGKGQGQSCLWSYNLGSADGSLTQGLWLPLGDYGIMQVPVGQ
jgi:hypothetical protein